MLKLRPLHTSLKRPAHYGLTLLTPCSRVYHSYEHEAPPPFGPMEDSILSAALSYVPTYGFTTTALARGARDAGYLDVSTNLFPTGAFSIVNYHLVTQRLALAKHTPPTPQVREDFSAGIKALALRRLHANRPVIRRWQEALALLATPSHLPTSVRELALLSDEFLFLAGNSAVTTAWYSNRVALASIYASAELFMTTDTSNDFQATEDFLTRRLEEGVALRNLLGGIGSWAAMQAGGVADGLRSKGLWI